MTARGQIAALDGLRGLAILLVILHNTNNFPDHAGWAMPVALLANAGWIGVQLFFVLSGYLITHGLLASRGAQHYFPAFFARRVLRIFPLYFLTLAGFLLVLPHVYPLPATVAATYRYQHWYWVFLNNWTEPSGQTVYWFPHFWSLAVEEQFYFVWPFLIAWLPVRGIAPLSLTLALAAWALRIVLYRAGYSPDMIYMYTVTRMDALAAGALLAACTPPAALRGFLQRRGGTALLLATCVLLFGALCGGLYNMHRSGTIYAGYTALTVGFGLLVGLYLEPTPSPAVRGLGRLLESRPLRAFGRYSYAIYLFHLPLSLLWPYRAGAGGHEALRALCYSLLVIAVSFCLGALSYGLIERHFLRLKRRFVPRPRPA